MAAFFPFLELLTLLVLSFASTVLSAWLVGHWIPIEGTGMIELAFHIALYFTFALVIYVALTRLSEMLEMERLKHL